MGKPIKMVGETYGELTVIEEFAPNSKKKCVCRCSCGNIVEKGRADVKHGNTRSCGCLKKRLAQERYTQDLTGQRFGKLVVLEQVKDYEKATTDGAYWRCACDCGKEAIVHRGNLKQGTSSCGCLKQDYQRQKVDSLVGKKFGEWTVLQDFVSREDGRCIAQCSCGEVTYQDRYTMSSGKTQGCSNCMGGRNKEKHKYDNIGLRQGRLTIVDVDDNYNYICRCDCGNTKVLAKPNWNGGVQSCGCYKTESTRKRCTDDLTGNVYGKITVLNVIYREGLPPKWKCVCECGNEFETNGGTLKNGCGMCPKCWAEHNTGENNPSWNPNLTEEDRERNRTTAEGSQERWRGEVFERDNYTCHCCGKRGGRLNAHHLNGYHWFKEGRFDVNNGVTLCTDCHKEFHSTYGIKNNTKEQYEEFYKQKHQD